MRRLKEVIRGLRREATQLERILIVARRAMETGRWSILTGYMAGLLERRDRKKGVPEECLEDVGT